MDFLTLGKKAAKLAGTIHLKYFQKKLKIRYKGNSFDLVTAADIESEKAAVRLIRKYYPGHNILAEENKYRLTPSPYTWIIDPLDGTNNFSSGLPIFCVSIALAYKDEVIMGAVYDATRDELFYAAKGKGAYLNGKKISVNSVNTLKKAIIITGFYYDRGAKMLQTIEAMKRFLVKKVIGIRRLGAAALDLCYVASGRAAGFWEFELSPWDFAAGKLFIEEAGGKVTGRKGEEVYIYKKHFIVASNKNIHSQMLSVINHP